MFSRFPSQAAAFMILRPTRLLAALLALALVLTGCGRLPAGGPASNEIISQVEQDNNEFAIYRVTRAFLPTVQHWPATGDQEHLGWIAGSAGPRTQIIQPGDLLSLRIWDSSENSLLTSLEERVVEMPNVKVAANGAIFMPYVGHVSVVGLSPDLAREELQASLEAIVPSAQVQLAMAEGRGNSVDLVGGVSRPGSYPMPDRNYTVLSLLAAGGGVRGDMANPQIRLMRGGAIYGTSVERLLDNPGLDTLLRGGDQVFVEPDERYFLSFGATGTEALHPFTKDALSAMDAVSIIGGVNDRRADPKGLLILREYPASAVAPGVRGPRNTRVVFSVDLTTFDGLFSARNFEINPNDLLLATESPINDPVTISNLIGNFFGVFNAAGVL
jgi:polysaccharide export outer membrane protein